MTYTVTDTSLLLGASLVLHLNDDEDEPLAYANGRHTTFCIFCDLLDGIGGVKLA